MPEEFLTVVEGCRAPKLNQQTVRNWIDLGVASALRVGQRVRIKGRDHDRILEGDTASRRGGIPTPSGLTIWDGVIPAPP